LSSAWPKPRQNWLVCAELRRGGGLWGSCGARTAAWAGAAPWALPSRRASTPPFDAGRSHRPPARGPCNGDLRTWSGTKVSSHKQSSPGAVGPSPGAGGVLGACGACPGRSPRSGGSEISARRTSRVSWRPAGSSAIPSSGWNRWLAAVVAPRVFPRVGAVKVAA